MRVEVFDDRKSVLHFILGFIPFFRPAIFIGFLAYELVELASKKEKVKYFLGDLLEYSLGFTFGSLLLDVFW